MKTCPFRSAWSRLSGMFRNRVKPTGTVLDDKTVLSLRHLSMRFGGLKAVDDLSFDVKEGEIFGLIGPNGAGKTTIFNCITRFYRASGGEILYRRADGKTLSLND